jgi:hypothetical protein
MTLNKRVKSDLNSCTVEITPHQGCTALKHDCVILKLE